VKHYVATDHLDSDAYRSLTPDDLLDVVEEKGLGWDDEREVGVVLHLVSAIAVSGRIGLTAIGDTLDEARQRYYAVRAAVDAAAS
jgi:pheganomycin biosynthesis PGM1-like protein